MNPIFRAACAFAAKGIPVFPCAPNAKHPLTPHGLRDASTDEATLTAWVRRWPAANLAMPTGLRSGFVVLDLDRKADRDGRATLSSIEADLGKLPSTLTVSTPSGGEHLYFRAPDAVIRNSAGRLGGLEAPGFDVRGDGGYVLIPPSTVDCVRYVWRQRMPPAVLPDTWIKVLARADRPATGAEPRKPKDTQERSRAERWCTRALQDEARALANAPEGTRNDHLWRAAAALGGLVHVGAFDTAEVRSALEWACASWSKRTPSKDRETLERGLAFGIANPRTVEMGDNRAA